MKRLADEHIAKFVGEVSANFDECYTDVPIAEKQNNELMGLNRENYKQALLSIDAIMSETGVVLLCGARQSGKTVLALKIAQECLKQDVKSSRAPVLVNINDFDLKSYKTTSLDALVRKSNARLEVDAPPGLFVSGHRCLFIVDDVSGTEPAKIAALRKVIDSNKDSHDWLILIDEFDVLSDTKPLDPLTSLGKSFYIQPLSRNEIRGALAKLPITVENENASDTVIQVIAENHLPRTHYIAGLLALAIKNNKLSRQMNEANLLDNLIDVVLRKSSIERVFRGPTDFRGLVILLGSIARWIDETGLKHIGENELLNRVSDFYHSRGIQANAGEVLKHFQEVGLLENVAGSIGFRFRAFAAFFLANFAIKDKEFRRNLFEGRNVLSYNKEIGLLCDMLRDDTEVLESLTEVCDRFRPEYFSKIPSAAFLDLPADEAVDIYEQTVAQVVSGPKSRDELDAMADFSERALQNSHRSLAISKTSPPLELEETALNFSAYLMAWTAWGRAIAALDFVRLDLRKPSFERLLMEWERLSSFLAKTAEGFARQGQPESETNQELPSKVILAQLDYICRVKLPIAMSMKIFSSIDSDSIQVLLTEIYDEIDKEKSESICIVMLLMHHRPVGWEQRVKQYIEEMPNNPKHRQVARILLEAASVEYSLFPLNDSERDALERIMADILSRSTFSSVKPGQILTALKRNRQRVKINTKDVF